MKIDRSSARIYAPETCLSNLSTPPRKLGGTNYYIADNNLIFFQLWNSQTPHPFVFPDDNLDIDVQSTLDSFINAPTPEIALTLLKWEFDFMIKNTLKTFSGLSLEEKDSALSNISALKHWLVFQTLESFEKELQEGDLKFRIQEDIKDNSFVIDTLKEEREDLLILSSKSAKPESSLDSQIIDSIDIFIYSIGNGGKVAPKFKNKDIRLINKLDVSEDWESGLIYFKVANGSSLEIKGILETSILVENLTVGFRHSGFMFDPKNLGNEYEIEDRSQIVVGGRRYVYSGSQWLLSN